jgi:hypothetical protein
LIFIEDLLTSENSREKFDQFAGAVKEVFQLNSSKKHINGKPLGRLEPTPSLIYKAEPATG